MAHGTAVAPTPDRSTHGCPLWPLSYTHPLFRLHKLHAAEWSSGYPPEVLQVAARELQRATQHHHALIAYVVAPKLQAPQVWVSEDGCAEVVTGIAVEEATGQPAQGRCVCELYTMKGWELGPPHGIP